MSNQEGLQNNLFFGVFFLFFFFVSKLINFFGSSYPSLCLSDDGGLAVNSRKTELGLGVKT